MRRHKDKEPGQVQRESLGFVLYIASFILLALYFLWALNPSSLSIIFSKKEKGSLEWIFGAILSALPSKDVTLYFPAIVVWIVCTYGSAYALLNLVTTPKLDELCTLYDAYSKPFKHSQKRLDVSVLRGGFDEQDDVKDNEEDEKDEKEKEELGQKISDGPNIATGPTGAAKVLSILLQEDESARQSARQEEASARKLFSAAATATTNTTTKTVRTTTTTTSRVGTLDKGEQEGDHRRIPSLDLDNLLKRNKRMPTPDVADLPITLVNRVMFGSYR